MDHVNAEQLAGHALGQPDDLTAAELSHLDGCDTCRTELQALVWTAETVRRGRDHAPVLPGPQVWQRIALEIGRESDHPTVTAPTPSSAAYPDEGPRDPFPIGPHRPRPRRASTSVSRRGMVLLAAAIGLILGAGGVVLANRVGDQQVVLASVALAPLPGQTGHGTAELVRTGGTVELRVDVQATAPSDDFRELWLINTDGKRMYAIGVLPPAGTASYPVPSQLAGALQGFTIVDVSIEPYDGNAQHSGVSLVRGTLPA